MTWVKVCGITDRRTAVAAVEAGSDAIGLVLAPSPRRVDADRATEIIAGLRVATYALTVDLPPDDVLALATRIGVTGIQPYGRFASSVAAAATASGLTVLRPVAVADEPPDTSEVPTDEMVLFDTAERNRHGGTGRAFDWSLLAGLERPFVLAGGLTPGNVREAITLTRPHGVDVSSGVETTPGHKSVDLIRAFLEEAKR